ncbi:hypothetical protein C2G38_2049782 [Gigaspora rosea]|uniref:F-box domain-containing protein n=1 Tax=Gigaspora rosea TaxID=44941 RepID=A0A397TXY4_9GLOM|nr:hypothetical protein C2G38_2049782 [Gigaspora rosea]
MNSCALVSRQWCKFIIPILWSEPGNNFRDTRLIRTCLLTLNAEEQASLIPFDISLPSHQKPLFEHTSFITSVNDYLSKGIKNWLSNPNLFSWLPYDHWFSYGELEHAVKCSLITMLLRTGKNLKYFYLDEIICNPPMLEYFYKNTTITSVDFHLSYGIKEDFKSRAIDGLVNILYKNSTLTSLNFKYVQLGTKEMKILLVALDKNTTINSLCFYYHGIRDEEEKIFFAKLLCKNTTLTYLNLRLNNLGSEGGKALANALCLNSTLTSLDLSYNNLGSEGGKALAVALCKNSTLKDLNLGFNNFGAEGGKALADALCMNSTLTSLNLNSIELGLEGGKALAIDLCTNSTLKDLKLARNNLESE